MTVGPAPSPSRLGALRHRGFLGFWLTSFVSNVGYAIQIVAQALLVYRLTGSSIWLGVVGAGSTLPFLVFTPLGGVYADRWRRRRAMMILQAILMTCAAGLALLVQLDLVRPWHVLAAALVSGSATALYNPTSQAIIKDLVGEGDVTSGVALVIGQFQVSRALGPFCAAWLLARAEFAWCFYANALSFVPFIAALGCLAVAAPAAPDRAAPLAASLRDGWRVATGDRALRIVLATSGLVGLFVVPLLALLPGLAERLFHVDGEALADLYALAGVGAACGAFSTRALAARFGWRTLLAIAAIVGVASIGGVGVVGDRRLGALLVTASTFATVIVWTTATATLHRLAPDRYRGRVLALNFLVYNLGAGIGNLAIGWCIAAFGSRPSLVGVAACGSVACGAVVRAIRRSMIEP